MVNRKTLVGKGRIGKYDKSVEGKKAKLLTEISFFNNFTRNPVDKHIFPAGTKITAVHEVIGTGLTTFKFKKGKNIYEHVVREGKFEYID